MVKNNLWVFFKQFKWLLLIILIVAILICGVFFFKHKQSILDKVSDYPQCPSNLEGILTYPLMESKYISYMLPLGNVNPPGHTNPVDHIYFFTTYTNPIPLYAPADSWITSITEFLKENNDGNYISDGYVVKYTICNTLVLDFASYTDLNPTLKQELTKQKPDCRYGIQKHEVEKIGTCDYKLKYKVKSGDEIGWVQAIKIDNHLNLPFEIWAADYNQIPRKDVNWNYYNDERYAHIMCPFDLYIGELKEQFYSKLGRLNEKGEFVPRTVAPICGQTIQNIVGTIQGDWFAMPSSESEVISTGLKSLSIVHNNADPTIGEISDGGNVTGSSKVFQYIPKHSGTFNRDSSEVKADEKIYCYSQDHNMEDSNKIYTGTKFLIQLIDDHHLKVEYQNGNCGTNETFKNSLIYQR